MRQRDAKVLAWLLLSDKGILSKLKKHLVFTALKKLQKNGDFQNTLLYVLGGAYRFPYNNLVAEAILDCCQSYNNFFALIKENPFFGELNLFATFDAFVEGVAFTGEEISDEIFQTSNFSISKLNQLEYYKTLEISNSGYKNIIISALFFIRKQLILKQVVDNRRIN